MENRYGYTIDDEILYGDETTLRVVFENLRHVDEEVKPMNENATSVTKETTPLIVDGATKKQTKKQKKKKPGWFACCFPAS